MNVDEDETADHEPNEPLLMKMVWANGMFLKFGPFGNPVTDFRQCFFDFVGGLRAEWSREKASVQFLGYNDTRGFLLFACSDDEKTMDIVMDSMPEMVELVIRDMGATLYFFLTTGEGDQFLRQWIGRAQGVMRRSRSRSGRLLR